jgi:hypothetical protein
MSTKKTYRYQLQPYSGKSSRFTCPSCNRKYQLTRYVDTVSGNYISTIVGICNHRNSCGYHYTPRQYFAENGYDKNESFISGPVINKPVAKSIDYITPVVLKKSINLSLKNNFLDYLRSIIPPKQVKQLVKIYNIGSFNQFNTGTTIFWQVDNNNRIRTGKLITYNPKTGKRVKKIYPPTGWIHNVMFPKDFNLRQCLFGEHLLKHYPNMPVAIVESEKTAIIASVKLPEYLWLATGSMTEFKTSKLKILEGRRVVAFPDLGGYSYWQKKAATMPFHVEVSDFLERAASTKQKELGLDIVDFL